MRSPGNDHRPFGATGLKIPPIVFRADVLDESDRAVPGQTKRLICGEWFQRIKSPVFIDVKFDQGDNSHLANLGRMLDRLEIATDEVVIHLELGALPDSSRSAKPSLIWRQFDTACGLLDEKYIPRLVSAPAVERMPRELEALKTKYNLAGVGIGLGDLRLVRELGGGEQVDFVALASGPTVLRHPPDMLETLSKFADRQVPVITAGVFHGGFLAGGLSLDGRTLNPHDAADQSLLTWRKAFTSLCHGHGVRPAHACIQFALSTPGVVAVTLSTSNPERVAENVEAAVSQVPDALWASLQEEGLVL